MHPPSPAAPSTHGVADDSACHAHTAGLRRLLFCIDPFDTLATVGMAQSCNGRFKSMAAACTSAAATPQERAEQARKSEEKSEQLVNKLFKKN